MGDFRVTALSQVTSSVSKLTASYSHEQAFGAPRHLSKYTAATMYPRLADKSGDFFWKRVKFTNLLNDTLQDYD